MKILAITLEERLPGGGYAPVAYPAALMPDPFSHGAGPALWALLHARALTHTGTDSTWLDKFNARIPAYCCGEDWHKWCAAHPPRWDDYFAWTVEAHNAVNVRLGKPTLGLAAAHALWEPLPPAA